MGVVVAGTDVQMELGRGALFRSGRLAEGGLETGGSREQAGEGNRVNIGEGNKGTMGGSIPENVKDSVPKTEQHKQNGQET